MLCQFLQKSNCFKVDLEQHQMVLSMCFVSITVRDNQYPICNTQYVVFESVHHQDAVQIVEYANRRIRNTWHEYVLSKRVNHWNGQYGDSLGLCLCLDAAAILNACIAREPCFDQLTGAFCAFGPLQRERACIRLSALVATQGNDARRRSCQWLQCF